MQEKHQRLKRVKIRNLKLKRCNTILKKTKTIMEYDQGAKTRNKQRCNWNNT